MTNDIFKLRAATSDDVNQIARVFSPSLRLLAFLPVLHSTEEDRWFIENVILKECRVWVAEYETSIISFAAVDGLEIRLLHTHPDFLSQGAGSLLIERAKETSTGSLELWCFQQNVQARTFYERHGFVAVEYTNGERNEEKVPDVRYRWLQT